MYYERGDGRDFNKGFISEGGFCGAIEALITEAPTRLNIEALEPSRLLVFPHRHLRSLYDRDPYWERVGRCFAERLLVKKVRKEAALLMDSASERYEAFLADNPSLENRIADYHVASYLGVAPETLSRLKRARTGRQRVAGRRSDL